MPRARIEAGERWRRLSSIVLAALIALSVAMPAAAVVGAGCVAEKVADVPITIISSRPLVRVSINGTPVSLILDSAASISTLSSVVAPRLNLSLVSPSPDRLRGIGGESTAQLTSAKHVALYGLSRDDVRFLVSRDLPAKATGMLGQNVLGQWNTEYDLGRGLIRLFAPNGCQMPEIAYRPITGQAVSEMDLSRQRPE